MRGQDVTAALAFTAVGRFAPYATLCSIGLIAGCIWRRWLSAALVEIALLLTIWRVSDACKAYFHRPRPPAWAGLVESSYAYPSGHAALSLAFYGFVAYVGLRAPLPRLAKRLVVVGCAAMIVGIGWSRLALGAHYPTDLVGGYLLGAAGLALAIAVYDRLASDGSRPAGTSAAVPERSSHA